MKRLLRNQNGFTLVELMVVVAIIAILAVIGVPNYQNYLVKSRRTAAEAEMMDIANRQQQFLLANRAYAAQADLEGTGYALSSEVSTYYDYTITLNDAGDPPSFLITFTPKSTQSTDGDLTLNSEGVKTPAEKW